LNDRHDVDIGTIVNDQELDIRVTLIDDRFDCRPEIIDPVVHRYAYCYGFHDNLSTWFVTENQLGRAAGSDVSEFPVEVKIILDSLKNISQQSGISLDRFRPSAMIEQTPVPAVQNINRRIVDLAVAQGIQPGIGLPETGTMVVDDVAVYAEIERVKFRPVAPEKWLPMDVLLLQQSEKIAPHIRNTDADGVLPAKAFLPVAMDLFPETHRRQAK
jgi:hypothetical protein